MDKQKNPHDSQGYRSDGTPITPWGDGNGPVKDTKKTPSPPTPEEHKSDV